MNRLVGLGATILILIIIGIALGALDRKKFKILWLLIAAALLAVNEACLTRSFGLLPEAIGGNWNWQGKSLALLATLAIASLPSFGWRNCGITLSQSADSLRSAIPVSILYCGLFLTLAVILPNEVTDAEEMVFQLTLPGLEEEPFFRGILLVALDKAYSGRKAFLGVDWGWGAVLSCFLFGMGHAFEYSAEGFSFDFFAMAQSTIPSFIGIWLLLKTRSLVLPALLHNFGNSVPLLI